MPGGVDLLFEIVELVLFAAAEFLMDGLELLVEVVLFLGPLHLPLHAGIDIAIDVELFDFGFQHFRDAIQAIEDDRNSRATPAFPRRESADWRRWCRKVSRDPRRASAAIMVS